MEIKNDRIEFSKSSWIYKLLTNFGVSKWDVPENSCTLLLMVGWRLVLLATMAAIFVVGWGLMLGGNLTANESGAVMTVVILSWFEAAALLVVGVTWLWCEVIPKWYKRVQCACPKVCWTEEK